MSQLGFLTTVAERLEHVGIPYMVVGSHASGFHGQARATQDVDIVVDPTSDQLDAFVEGFAEGYYVSQEAARDALQRRAVFNVIDLDGGWKADIIIRKERPFSIEEFKRRQSMSLEGRLMPVASPEDVILTKLEWNRITPSERQVSDALAVAVMHRENLDRDYLKRWAEALRISQSLEQLLTDADAAQNP
jgi:hypothetical protein